MADGAQVAVRGAGAEPRSIVSQPVGQSGWYAVAVLATLYALAMIDRNVMSLMVDDIKADLAISDVQYSLLQGLAFAIFYSTMGLPLGGLLDRFARRPLIFAGVIFWSLAATATGFSQGFAEIFVARVAIGIGEAVLLPGANSLIGDLFPKKTVSAPLSVLIAGGTLGAAMAVMVGGHLLGIFERGVSWLPLALHTLAPWRLVLLTTALPGLVLGFLIFTVAEPTRARDRDHDGATWREFVAHMAAQRRIYISLLLGLSLLTAVSYISLSWTPTFMRRHLGLSAVQTGAIYGSATAGCGLIAHSLNGFIVNYLFRRGINDAPMRFCLASTAIGLPFAIAAFIVPSVPAFIVCLCAMLLLVTPVLGYGSGAVQMVTPPRMRGKAAALLLLIVNVIGLGIAPLFVAVLTDHVFGGPANIGWSIITAIGLVVPAGLALMWSVRGPFRRAIDGQAR